VVGYDNSYDYGDVDGDCDVGGDVVDDGGADGVG